jgi:hypothetical protein
MTLVTNFERTPDGQYTSIEQVFDGGDIPEGSTFVAFDAVKFARSTGQVALVIGIEYGTIEEDGSALVVENRDDRWQVWGTIEDGALNLRYYGLGSAMMSALIEQGVEKPELSADCLKVAQRIDVIRGIHYIGDGPLDHTAKDRRNDTLPAPGTDISPTPEGEVMVAVTADPHDYL